MDFPLKISFLFFLLIAANGQFVSGSSEDLQEKSRQFHANQNNKTREIIKSEMNELYSGLLESLSQQLKKSNLETLSKFDNLNERILKMERHQEELSSNLSRTLYENMEKLNQTLLGSFNAGLSKSELRKETSLLSLSQTLSQKSSTYELKMEESLANLSGLLSGELRRWDSKLETSLRNLSESLGGRLPSSESQESGELGTPNQTTERKEQQLPSTTTLSTAESPTEMIPTSQLPTQTELEEVDGNNGTIEFGGEVSLGVRRKIWVLRTEGINFRYAMRFVMEENNLGEAAHLSLWESPYGENVHVWNGSQTDWRTERTTFGPLVLLTLVVKPSANPGPPPSFKLTFTSSNWSTGWNHSGEIVTKDGVESLSFPHQNAQNYSPGSAFHAVIAPQSGRPFSLTLKYLDVAGPAPDCWDISFFVYFLEESPTETNYKMLDKNKFSECGRLGNVSQFLGTSTVAVVRFYAWFSSNTGRGFRMEIKPTDSQKSTSSAFHF